jgi:hypothetical protein
VTADSAVNFLLELCFLSKRPADRFCRSAQSNGNNRVTRLSLPEPSSDRGGGSPPPIQFSLSGEIQ